MFGVSVIWGEGVWQSGRVDSSNIIRSCCPPCTGFGEDCSLRKRRHIAAGVPFQKFRTLNSFTTGELAKPKGAIIGRISYLPFAVIFKTLPIEGSKSWFLITNDQAAGGSASTAPEASTHRNSTPALPTHKRWFYDRKHDTWGNRAKTDTSSWLTL